MASRRSRLKKRLKQLLPVVTVSLTTLPFAMWTSNAQAFFPPVWNVPPVAAAPPVLPPPLIVEPPVVPPPFVPPPPPPLIVVPPVVPPPLVVVPQVNPTPCGVPEPATLVSGLIGLAAAAGYGLRRREKKSADGEPGA